MREFVILMAYLMALVALSIDAMLPALGIMGADLGVTRANDMQLVVVFLFVGMTFGQLVYGPLADAIGRKPALYSGLALFIGGSVLCYTASSLPLMLLGRCIQGLGVSAPRIIVMAIVRDRFHGRDMASVMSLVMGVFILVPAVAPAIGQCIIHLYGWRMLFIFYIAATLIAVLWASTRLSETLAPENRRPFHLRPILQGFREAASNRITLGYTLCSGFAFGALLGYLNSTQQIFHDIFHTGDKFALYFGILAIAIGAAFFLNSALVQRYGMRRITRLALIALIIASFAFTLYTLTHAPSLLIFMLYASLAFFCLGLSFGNMGAMALEPMGHMAGLASAFMGCVSSGMSLVLGTLIGQLYQGTLLPLASGFLLLALASYLTMQWTERTARITG